MTEDTQPGANREVRPAAQTRTRTERQLDATAEATRLKKVLFAALGKTGFNLKEIAEICGLENANLLYNLKNGHSQSLAVQTYTTLSRKLNVPINELLGMPVSASGLPASVRVSASMQVAAERLARSLVYVRTANEQFHERYVGHDHSAFDHAAQIDFLAAYLRMNCGLEAVARDVIELLDQLREVVPDIPTFPPL